MDILKKISLVLIILSIGFGTFLVFYKIINRKSIENNQIISPLAQVLPTITSTIENRERSDKALEYVVRNALVGTQGTYGIVIENLKTGKSYFANEHKRYDAGSLYKIWIMAEAFNQIQNGTLKEDEILSEDIAVLNEKFKIASESAEQTEGVVTFTVKEALEQMITISHNYASLLLSKRIRLSSVKKFLEKNAFYESSIGEPPHTTPYGVAIFLERLYKKEIIDQESSEKMLELLKRQQLNNGIPKYLPEGVVIAHKTGEIEAFKHDAGIVYSPEADYIIVVISESDAPLAAQERIAQVSQAVYEYFNAY